LPHLPLQCDSEDNVYQSQGQQPGWQFTHAGDAGLLITNYGANLYYFPVLERSPGHITASMLVMN